MEKVLLSVICIVLIILIVRRWLPRRSVEPDGIYQPAAVLSPAEAAFIEAIEGCVPPEFRVLAKVRIADAITPVSKGNQRLADFRRISQKHVDFLVVRKEDNFPALAIELDDKSHERSDRRRRDRFVDAAFASAGVPIYRERAAASYNAATLHLLIGDILQQRKASGAMIEAAQAPACA